jgi:hypothetical protein
MTGITRANRHCEPRALRLTKRSLLVFLAVGAASVLLSPDSASACSVCAGDPASPMTAGMNSAIWALLAITGTVLSTFVGFFLFLWRRARSAKRTQIDTAWLDGLRGVKNV